MKTGWESMRVGSIIYFIPFFFVLNPAFVLQGPLAETLVLTVTCAIGIVFICGGIQGYQMWAGDLSRLRGAEWPLRMLLIAGGMVLAAPGGGLMPLSNAQMALFAAAILVPTMAAARLLARRTRAA
jgi:TRAP-type uncharacterized transport system fused permease subunit